MADAGQGGAQEKTEEPTSKRLNDARKRGDVWQSRDFTATVVMVVFALAAIAGAKPAVAWLAQYLNDAVLASTERDTDVLRKVRDLMAALGWWAVGAPGAPGGGRRGGPPGAGGGGGCRPAPCRSAA